MITPLAALAFAVELAALGILARWGAQTDGPAAVRWGLALGLPLLFSIFWGLFLSPRARLPQPTGRQVSLKLVLFAGVSLALWQVWGPIPALLFLAAGVASSALTHRP